MKTDNKCKIRDKMGNNINIKKSKKGFVFTLITLLLLSSIFLITSSYLKRNIQSQEFITNSAFSNKLKFLRENIVSDFYAIMDIELDEVVRNDTHVKIKFTNFSHIQHNSTYGTELAKYERFIETNYSKMENMNFRIEKYTPAFSIYPFEPRFQQLNSGLTPEFFIYPYNSSFLIDYGNLYFYAYDINKLQGIEIDIKVNVSDNISISPLPADDGPGNPLIWLRIFDNESNLTLNQSLRLSRTEEGQDFFISYNRTTYFPNITVSFGRYRRIRYYGPDLLTDGMLYVGAKRLDADIERFNLYYNVTDKKVIMKTYSYMYLD